MEIVFKESAFSACTLFLYLSSLILMKNIDEYVEKSKSNDPCTEEKIIFL